MKVTAVGEDEITLYVSLPAIVAVTVQVPGVCTESESEVSEQPVAVPSAITYETAPADNPPLTTSARGVPRTPSRDATLSAL